MPMVMTPFPIVAAEATSATSITASIHLHGSIVQRPQTSAPSHTKLPPVSASIKYFSRNFPFTPLGNVDDASIIQEKLPAWERANLLCNSYFEQAGWLFHGVTRDQIYEDMLPAIYRKKTERQQQQQGGISSLGSTLSSPASSTSSPYVNTSPISTTISTSDNSKPTPFQEKRNICIKSAWLPLVFKASWRSRVS
ncbi:hypothetical protein ONZ45_g17223 [Pleurotus djamor]|nr:hypothetical protein ONZ45_g17223 [Pleurotus djamor]